MSFKNLICITGILVLGIMLTTAGGIIFIPDKSRVSADKPDNVGVVATVENSPFRQVKDLPEETVVSEETTPGLLNNISTTIVDAEQVVNSNANLIIAGHLVNGEGNKVAGMPITISPTSNHYLSRTHAGNKSLNETLTKLETIVVKGQVRDHDGVPIPGVSVFISGTNDMVVTNHDGEFNQALSIPGGKNIPVQFSRTGYQRYRTTIDAARRLPGTEFEFDVVLERGSVDVTGSVVDKYNSPVVGAHIHLYSRYKQAFANGISDETGGFAVTSVVPADDYQIKVMGSDDYQQYEQSNLTISGNQAPLDIRVQNHNYGSFSGRIVDANGLAVTGLALFVKTRGTGGSIAVTTDQAGEFTSGRVSGGSIRLYTHEPNISVGDFELAPGQTLSHVVTVDIGSQQLYGIVTNAYGEPVPGAKVVTRQQWNTAVGVNGNSRRDSATDVDGKFEFQHLGSGTRTITITAPGFVTQKINLNPSEHEGPHWVTLTPDA